MSADQFVLDDDIPFKKYEEGPREEHPQIALERDYETLIRLARRCAYDLAHVMDYVKPGCYFDEPGFRERARSWLALFKKGNPGKDYRMEIQRDNMMLESRASRLEEELNSMKRQIDKDRRWRSLAESQAIELARLRSRIGESQ